MIELPWPPKELSPNARIHWAKRSKIAAKYRADCHVLCRQAGFKAPEGKMLLILVFVPPDKRRRDDDNCLAAFKSGRDGLADALGIDDSRFVTQLQLSDETTKGGAVRARIEQYREAA